MSEPIEGPRRFYVGTSGASVHDAENLSERPDYGVVAESRLYAHQIADALEREWRAREKQRDECLKPDPSEKYVIGVDPAAEEVTAMEHKSIRQIQDDALTALEQVFVPGRVFVVLGKGDGAMVHIPQKDYARLSSAAAELHHTHPERQADLSVEGANAMLHRAGIFGGHGGGGTWRSKITGEEQSLPDPWAHRSAKPMFGTQAGVRIVLLPVDNGEDQVVCVMNDPPWLISRLVNLYAAVYGGDHELDEAKA